jgi:hypothetical protein
VNCCFNCLAENQTEKEEVMRSVWHFSAWRAFWLGLALFVVAGLSVPVQVKAVTGGGIISLTNSRRAAAGLPPLSYNAALSTSANMKARHMLSNQYWAHTGPDGSTGWTFMRQAGYSYVTAGENLANGFTSDSAVISGWMASPSHKANILHKGYRDIGVAVVSGTLLGRQTTLVVAHYGSRTNVSAPVVKKSSPMPKSQAAAPVKPKAVTRPSVKPKVVKKPAFRNVVKATTKNKEVSTVKKQPQPPAYLELLRAALPRGGAELIVVRRI